MSDVSVTIGANATPYMRVLAEVQAAAKKTGDVVGLELGSRRQAGEEMRMQRGLDTFLRSIAGATDPISAVTGAVEGLGRAFRIVGPLMLVTGIGGFLYDEFSKAKESADQLTDSLRRAADVNVATSSIAELRREVESFEKIEEKYQGRSLLEKIFFGRREDALHQAAVEINEVKKATIELDEAARAAALSEAKLLQASTNVADQKRGAALSQQISTQDEITSTRDSLEQAQKQYAELTKTMANLRAKREELAKNPIAVETGASPMSPGIPYRDAEAKATASREKEKRENEAALAAAESNIKDKLGVIANYQTALANFQAKAGIEAMKSTVVNDSAAIQASAEIGKAMAESQSLAFQDEYEKATAGRKAAMLRGKLADDKSEAARNAPLQTALQRQEAINKIKQDELKLDSLLTEQARTRAGLLERRHNLEKDAVEARTALDRAQVDAQGFHGEVSSLRRLGFAGGIGANHNNEQLKAVQETNKRLEKIEVAIRSNNHEEESLL